jgi:hypothetical protein
VTGKRALLLAAAAAAPIVLAACSDDDSCASGHRRRQPGAKPTVTSQGPADARGSAPRIDVKDWQEELLALNPWARELWERRWDLVDRQQWNLVHVDQGGNAVTRRWLTEFQTARREATLERLRAGRAAWDVWADRTSAIIAALSKAGYWEISVPSSRTWSDKMPPYTPGFLTADVLLLARAGFYKAAIEAGTDFTDMRFPGGADFRGAHIPPGTRFDRATFGDRTGFDNAWIGAGASLRGAVFGRWASFTFARLEESVDLAEASFGFASAFSGAWIGGRVSFSSATFGESTAFEGTSIGPGVRFDSARFHDEARFGGSVFGDGVSFERANFEGSVSFYAASGRRPSFEAARFGCRDPFSGASFS